MHRIDPSIHLLLIEDDEIDILHIKYALRENNIANKLDIAQTGIEALNKIYKRDGIGIPTPKLIILDINLPKMNGLEFLKLLKQDILYDNIPVIIVTTSSADNDLKKAQDLNVAGYFNKPLDINKFMVLYDKLVGEQGA